MGRDVPETGPSSIPSYTPEPGDRAPGVSDDNTTPFEHGAKPVTASIGDDPHAYIDNVSPVRPYTDRDPLSEILERKESAEIVEQTPTTRPETTDPRETGAATEDDTETPDPPSTPITESAVDSTQTARMQTETLGEGRPAPLVPAVATSQNPADSTEKLHTGASLEQIVAAGAASIIGQELDFDTHRFNAPAQEAVTDQPADTQNLVEQGLHGLQAERDSLATQLADSTLSEADKTAAAKNLQAVELELREATALKEFNESHPDHNPDEPSIDVLERVLAGLRRSASTQLAVEAPTHPARTTTALPAVTEPTASPLPRRDIPPALQPYVIPEHNDALRTEVHEYGFTAAEFQQIHHLTDAEMRAIADYSGATARTINTALRGGDTSTLDAREAGILANLQTAMGKMPKTAGGELVFRGVPLRAVSQAHEVTDPAPLNVSSDPIAGLDTARQRHREGNAGLLLRIALPADVHYIPLCGADTRLLLEPGLTMLPLDWHGPGTALYEQAVRAPRPLDLVHRIASVVDVRVLAPQIRA
jgi:hypothetical protein